MLRCLVLAALIGCKGAEETDPVETDADTDADTDSDTDADTDSDTDADTDADADHPFTVAWDGNGVTITLADTAVASFEAGMAETGAGVDGWYGEDCLHGTATWHLCHGFTGHEGRLESVYPTLADVVEGSTTLFPQTLAPDLTYVVRTAADCWVYGEDPAYYTDDPAFSDCALLPP